MKWVLIVAGAVIMYAGFTGPRLPTRTEMVLFIIGAVLLGAGFYMVLR